MKPELAHRWEYDAEKLVWTFYLRPGLTFHDGQPVDAKQLVSLFTALQPLPFYQTELAHVASVYSEQPLRISFQLTKADTGFAGLLAGVKYSIQPAAQVTREPSPLNSVSHAVIGTGPFKVVETNNERIKLAAFEHYYGCRSLTDEVTIWQFEESMTGSARFDDSQMQVSPYEDSSCFHQLGKSDAKLVSAETDGLRSRVEDGCLFILFNQNSAASLLTDEQRKYMYAGIANPQAVLSQLEQNQGLFSVSFTQNILPSWHKLYRTPPKETQLPKKMSIAVYNYYALYRCAICVSDILKRYGVEVEVNTYSFRELAQLSQSGDLKEDLVLCNLNLDDNAPSSLFSWLMNDPVCTRH